MANICGALTRIKSELGQWIDQELVEQSCREGNHRWRRRRLDPLSSVHLLMLQLLAQVALRGLRHVAQVSLSAQAICQARMRLPLEVMLSLVRQACKNLCGEGVDAPELWNGHRVLLGDGMSFLTPDTPELAGRFGKASNQHGSSCSYPVPKLLAMLDLGSGLISKVIALPHARQERTCLGRLLSYLQPGDVLLLDRGFAGFAQVAMMLAAGVHCCMRLPQWLAVVGRGKGNRRRIRKLGRNDLLVRWIKPNQSAGWMSRNKWALLPAELMLRQINFRIKRPGFRHQWMRVITTLLDPKRYPAEQIIELYAKRWQVEVCFRDMKRTLGMKQMRSRSVAGVRKEICAFVLLYNLIRHVMRRAAAAMNVEPDRVSFIDAMRWLLWSPPGTALDKLVVNPRRGRKPEPRVLKRGSHKYPLMRKPRKVLQDELLRELNAWK
ncbi:MAG: IS4 family transposase [Tepidisphaeraceae bacterium]|jgi:hypothetical protein